MHNSYRDSGGRGVLIDGEEKKSQTFFQFVNEEYKFSEERIREMTRSLPGLSEDDVKSSLKRAHDALKANKIKWPQAMANFVDTYYGPDGKEVHEDRREDSKEKDRDVEYYVTDYRDPAVMSVSEI